MVDEAEQLFRDVGARLAAVRRARGETQEALAQRLGMSAKHLQRIEAGLENLTLRTIHGIARALEVGALELFRPPISAPRRTGRPPKAQASPKLGLARVTPGTLLTTAVPLLSLVARAGAPDTLSETGVVDWLELPGRRTAPGLFATRIVGTSMAPRFPDGALLLFRAVADGLTDANGALVLVEVADDAGGSAYIFKRLRLDDALDGASRPGWLESLASDTPPLPVMLGDAESTRVVAVFVEVIASGG